MTPADFRSRINRVISEKAAAAGQAAGEEMLLSEDEVLSIRLYTGPGFAPLNTWLRSIGKLDTALRRKLSRSPAFTYAATIRHICSAIRKIARFGDGGEASCMWRGIVGKMPESFWNEDNAGMVCATELGLLSVSTDMPTPMHYMSPTGANVLLELSTSGEDESGFHCGADVSPLSQYSEEKEVLFPPLTMLRVKRRQRESVSSRGDAIDNWEVSDEVTGDGKSYQRIAVTPTFV